MSFSYLESPELDAALQMGSHKSKVEGENHLSCPAGHTAFDPEDRSDKIFVFNIKYESSSKL